MKRILGSVIFLLAVLSVFLPAVEVDRDELETVEPGAVEFLNYEGPHEVINTRNEIISIGRLMGARITTEPGTFRYHSKYSVIHALGPEDEEGTPADIFIIEPGAGVDHIRNLRRIIGGYLSSAYGYEFETALLIAEFVTIYNAVHRRDMETFATRYTQTVLGHLDPDKAGISTRYDEWAGNTMMLIPLTRRAGDKDAGPGAVSSEEISSDEVIEKLREDDDRGLEQRKGMVELREEEAEAEQDRIAGEQEELEEEQGQLEEKEKELEEELERAREEGTGDEEEIERELEETREELKETEERRQDLEEEAAAQEERVERIRDEREQIAEDEKALMEETAAPRQQAEAGTLFMLYSERAGSYSGTLVRVDPVTGKVKKRASGITVLGKTFVEDAGSVFCIGEAAAGFVTVLSVDAETLEVRERGTEQVHRDSNILVTARGVYAVVESAGNTYLGRFDDELSLADRSADTIVPYSYIKESGNTVMVQSKNGDVLVLDADSLELAD